MKSLIVPSLVLCCATAHAQSPLGLFDGHGDVGTVRRAGSVTYDPRRQEYVIGGSGQNMWGNRDDFQFVWKRVSGNFVLSTRARFIGTGVEEHRKIGWTIRPSLASNGVHVTAALHGNGLMSLQFRRTVGGTTEEEKSRDSLPDGDAVIQLERRDGVYILSVGRAGDALVTQELSGVALPDTVYVGLFVCAHNDTVVERARFSDVRITRRVAWQPSPAHAQIQLWPGAVPDSLPAAGPEDTTTTGNDHLVAGKPWHYIRNVTRPTLTVYAPSGSNTGAAVVVFPGGGYQILAIDLEGTEVCDWLVSRGITCVLLKYRVPKTGPSWQPDCRCRINPKPAPALEDAQRALGLVRLHATGWHIDPHKIGVLGFSAGGHLVAAISNGFQQRLYAAVDLADKESARPDFAVALYPGHLWMGGGGEQYALNPDIHVTRETPPTFLLQAETDSVDNVNQALVYYIALKDAGVPVEMHLYRDGGHAFGLRRTKDPITDWPHLVENWLQTTGIISR